VAAAARSIPTTPNTLLRLTLGDPELQTAYEQCVSGVLRDRRDQELAAKKQERKAAAPRVTERTAERRKARLFATIGKDPRIAAAALHKRLNHEKRQEKAADLEAALDSLAELQTTGKLTKPIAKETLDLWDRWCARCKAYRVDDPCEVCRCHTLLVKGDGGPTTRTSGEDSE